MLFGMQTVTSTGCPQPAERRTKLTVFRLTAKLRIAIIDLGSPHGDPGETLTGPMSRLIWFFLLLLVLPMLHINTGGLPLVVIFS
jgi:hypothetical protein